jgi:hypothetical protein
MLERVNGGKGEEIIDYTVRIWIPTSPLRSKCCCLEFDQPCGEVGV